MIMSGSKPVICMLQIISMLQMDILKVHLLECWCTDCRCLLDGNIYAANPTAKIKKQIYFIYEYIHFEILLKVAPNPTPTPKKRQKKTINFYEFWQSGIQDGDCNRQTYTFQEHLGSPLVFSGLRVARSSVMCVVFCRILFVPFSFFLWSM